MKSAQETASWKSKLRTADDVRTAEQNRYAVLVCAGNAKGACRHLEAPL